MIKKKTNFGGWTKGQELGIERGMRGLGGGDEEGMRGKGEGLGYGITLIFQMGNLREYRRVIGGMPVAFRDKLDRVLVVRDEGELWAEGVRRLLGGGYDVVCRGDGRMVVNGSMMWIRDGVIMVGGWSVGEFMRLGR